jgi:prepilin-type N-terminal cleavage/methylation domain-containing protein
MTPKRRERLNASGFTLVELLVVVALIAVMIAVSLPAITGFLRHYRIRGATQELAGELQTARSTAIKKNVNFGVVFLVTGVNTYRYLVEDALAPPPPGPRIYDNAFLAGNPDRVFPEHTLPPGIQFATTAAECPASTQPPVSAPFAPTAFSLRFTRLGAFCDPGSNAQCPAVLPARLPNTVMAAAGGAVLCVREFTTGRSRTLFVTPSGQLVDQR